MPEKALLLVQKRKRRIRCRKGDKGKHVLCEIVISSRSKWKGEIKVFKMNTRLIATQ